ncbi:hypothetical protein LWI28_021671 [Acer negundo]|uniref:Uncharacterized protein n=1 Tax=Acer negundo TaxID=4023 RepID=A0AAD5J685_ACENE|nr:hypothetical protein LWI28_021671 [Acer negundo]
MIISGSQPIGFPVLVNIILALHHPRSLISPVQVLMGSQLWRFIEHHPIPTGPPTLPIAAAAAAARVYKSSQLDRFSNQAVHGSKLSDDHQRFSTGRVSRSDQYHSSSSSSSVSYQSDGFSTMAVHGSSITKLDRTKPLQLHQLQTNSSSASSTFQPRLIDGLM